MEMELLDDARESLHWYNTHCVHYNLIADGVYQARRNIGDPFAAEFQPYIVAGLIGFDMRRTMGESGGLYSADKGFGLQLSNRIKLLRRQLRGLISTDLAAISLRDHRSAIEGAYESIAAGVVTSKRFDVGATKVLHWLFPDLFIMIDRNVAATFRRYFEVQFRSGTQPGYLPEKYFECLEKAQRAISQFGRQKFRNLERVTPVARIFDKIAFATGQNLAKGMSYPEP
jgi:hypothetical protein